MAEGQKTLSSNKRATHDFNITERFECGIVLTGAEVKSIRGGRASMAEAFARIRDGEMWIEGMHIPPYEHGDKRGYEPTRPRKLLLHRRELDRIDAEAAEQGLTLVPMRAYLAHGMVKIEIGLGKGKREFEKRAAIAKREAAREIEQRLGRRR